MIKHWFTLTDIADMQLPELPSTRPGLMDKAKRETWRNRPRKGSGGGFEYHLSSLPAQAQIALVERLVDYKPADLDFIIGEDNTKPDNVDRAARRRDARLVILKLFDVFRGASGMGRVAAMKAFEMVYASRKAAGCPSWVYETFSSVTWQTIHRWSKCRKRADLSGLAGRYGNRLGTGILESGQNGAVKAFIAAHIIKQPHLTGVHVRDLVRAQFGDMIEGKPLPNTRTFLT
jgi:putative transposase